MDLRIKGKVALVTAASKGLGKAVAIQLASEGANVIICSRNLESLQKAKFAITNKTNMEVSIIACDVTNEQQVKQMIDSIIEEFGTISSSIVLSILIISCIVNALFCVKSSPRPIC